MSKYKYYEVSVFTNEVFAGNPAGVCLLKFPASDSCLQAIAEQNNLSETAFVVQSDDQLQIRWFTPASEVDLCGHATLAAAHVLFNEIGYQSREVTFHSQSGILKVSNTSEGLAIDLPRWDGGPVVLDEQLLDALKIEFQHASLSRDLLVRVKSQTEVEKFQPNDDLIKQLPGLGLILTAPGNRTNFVSRCFFPKVKVSEDPVTGSAACILAPYWSHELEQQVLHGHQCSRRGGDFICKLNHNCVTVIGTAKTYLRGEIFV